MLQTATRETPIEMRRHGRHRVMLSARLYTAHGSATVVLLDLSRSGAMLALPLPLPRDSHVVLVRGDFEAHARVVWAQGRRCGLEFDDIVDDDMVDQTICAIPRSAH